jgi:hypothetical protein
MTTFTLTIDTDNAAFEDHPQAEVAGLHKDGTGWSRTFDRIEDAEDLALRLAVTSGRTAQIVETVITVTL